MIDAILKLSVRARWAIVLVVAAVAAVGAWQLTRLPIDATTASGFASSPRFARRCRESRGCPTTCCSAWMS